MKNKFKKDKQDVDVGLVEICIFAIMAYLCCYVFPELFLYDVFCIFSMN